MRLGSVGLGVQGREGGGATVYHVPGASITPQTSCQRLAYVLSRHVYNHPSREFSSSPFYNQGKDGSEGLSDLLKIWQLAHVRGRILTWVPPGPKLNSFIKTTPQLVLVPGSKLLPLHPHCSV